MDLFVHTPCLESSYIKAKLIIRVREIKRKIALTKVVSFMFGYIIGSPYVFSTGNPLPIVSGIMQISLNQGKIIKISNNPDRYITRQRDGSSPFIEMMSKKGWEFREHLLVSTRTGYEYGPRFTNSNGDWMSVKDVRYTRKFRVWEVLNLIHIKNARIFIHLSVFYGLFRKDNCRIWR